MAISKVSFSTATGGLGRLPLGEDYISALIGTISVGISGFATTDLMKEFRSLAEVEAAGITEGSTSPLIWYHAREYFRIANASVLWIINSGVSFSVESIIQTSKGKIRQLAYVTPVTNATIASEAVSKNSIAVQFEAAGAPLHIILGIADSSITGVASLNDLRTLNSQNVSVVAMGDGAGKGNQLAASLTLPLIPAIGACLGTLAKASVNESIGWVGKFNMSLDGIEYTKVRDAKGTLIQHPTTILDAMDDKGFIFFRTFVGNFGSYWNFGHTATAITSDFATVENNRTMAKAKRLINDSLITDLNSPLTVEASGKLAPDTVKYFENKISRQLDTMRNDGEISEYNVLVDPEQNVLSTNILKIQVRVIPRGVAKFITINIGYTVNLS